jgi:hypothetical protein
MTKSAPRTRALALWLPSKVSTEVARRCRTRCDKRHSGVNCKLVQMRLAVCGQGAGCGEKWLLHLPSEQLVHLGCPSACSTAWTGRRAPFLYGSQVHVLSPQSTRNSFSWPAQPGRLLPMARTSCSMSLSPPEAECAADMSGTGGTGRASGACAVSRKMSACNPGITDS